MFSLPIVLGILKSVKCILLMKVSLVGCRRGALGDLEGW